MRARTILITRSVRLVPPPPQVQQAEQDFAPARVIDAKIDGKVAKLGY